MSFEKFVQKSTKGLFIFIAVAMVLPLVLWGYMGGDGTDPAGQEVVGTVYGDRPVRKAHYDRMVARAMVDWWWKQHTGPNAYLMRFRPPEPPKAEELDKLAWENIVLLEDARLKGISASQKEVDERLREMYQMLTRGQASTQGADEILAGIVRQAFHSDLRTFDEWIGDLVVIDKLLDTVTEASFASYEDVYSQMSQDQVLARAWVAGFDPKAFEKKLRPSTSYEITRRYEQNKGRYKVPAKASVTALTADLEAFKKGLPEPTEAEMRTYYDGHKSEFEQPHAHAPGEHQPDEKAEYKPFEQVKGELGDKVKTEKARKAAQELMGKVDTALGALYDGKGYPPDAFDKLKAQFKAQGAELAHDVLPRFAARDVEDLEKSIGTGSGLGAWAFDPKNQKGAVSRPISTTKGVYLFRLVEKSDAYEAGVTERVRESLERELRKDQVKQRASKAATDVVQAITTRGMETARRAMPGVEWTATRYFKPRGGDTGLEDRGLGQAVAAQAASLTPGKASVLAGAQAGKPEWSYVVYLEDRVPAPENAEADFSAARNRLDADKRRQMRESYPATAVAEARIQKAGAAPKS
jgi:hypothetical protein